MSGGPLTRANSWLRYNDIQPRDIALFCDKSISTIAHYNTGRIPVSDEATDAVHKLAVQKGIDPSGASDIATEYVRLCNDAYNARNATTVPR